MPDERLPRQRRVRRNADYQRAYASSCHAADDVLVVNAAPNATDTTRLGLAVSRAVGNAVERNRWKRRIREVFRRCRAQLPPGLDLVVRPRRGARLDYHAIAESLPRLARKVAEKLASRRKAPAGAEAAAKRTARRPRTEGP